jgi:hypothetical protein
MGIVFLVINKANSKDNACSFCESIISNLNNTISQTRMNKSNNQNKVFEKLNLSEK